MEEVFTYDDMNRLTDVTLKRPSGQDLNCSATYDAFGRMTSKQAVVSVNNVPQVTTLFSLPSFDITKVHALSQAQTSDGIFPSTAQTVAYTGFDKVNKVKQGADSLCYSYGYDRQRILMEEHVGNTLRTKRYVGNCEYLTETTSGNTDTYWLTYLTGPYGVFAVVMSKSGNDDTFYVLKDNLGSWTTITDENGTVEQRLSYDAWGNLRNPQTWANYTQNDVFDKPMFDRGYTGHEHLATFGLINMNGRVYDPVMSSFLSADRYVQDPSSAQGFNRYAYCLYNPLRYVDPTGWRSGGGGGHSPDNPPHYVYMDGWSGYLIDEVTIVDSRIFNFEIDYTSHYNAGGGSDNPWNEANDGQPTGYKSGSGGGNGNHGGYSNNTTTSQNVNVEIGSKLLIPANLYTTTMATSYYNEFTRQWQDKLGVMRDLDFNGNQYTGGKNSFGKMMSKRYTNAGRVLGLVGVGLSYYQFDQATTTEEKLEYGFDTFIGFAGVVAPEFFGLPATIWFLGGKQVTFWYSRTTIIPMIENGINPGLMENQPFK